jgi:uncharacterized protein
MTLASGAIKHDEKNGEFYLLTSDGRALLSYTRDGDVLDFHHTFVPDELRGQGIAQKLVEAGFEYVKKNNLKVFPSCPYVLRVVSKNEGLKEWVKRTTSS